MLPPAVKLLSAIAAVVAVFAINGNALVMMFARPGWDFSRLFNSNIKRDKK
jgi:hypothetical protein